MFTQPLRNPFVLYGLLILLGSFVVYRGILPALTRVDSDFPNYYTAAKIVADAKDAARLYDDQWFQDQIRSYGIGLDGKFSPFPPATALVLLPLTAFDPLTALRITVVINLILLGLSIRVLSILFSSTLLESAVFTLFSGIGLANCIRLGQLYLVLSFLIIAGYYAYTQKRKAVAGICFGLFIPIKYYPIVILAYFAFRREWKIVMTGLATAALVALLGILVLGWDVHKVYLSSVIGGHLASHFSLQNSFSATFQSWDSLLRRLLVFDPALNPYPLFAANDIFPGVKITLLVLQFALGLVALMRVHRLGSVDAEPFSIGMLGVLALLLAPGTGTYHYILLWLPVGLLFSYFVKHNQKPAAYAIFGFYAAMGFIPYSLVRQFDGLGAWTLLAYPRLALLLAIFVLTLCAGWNRTTSESVQE